MTTSRFHRGRWPSAAVLAMGAVLVGVLGPVPGQPRAAVPASNTSERTSIPDAPEPLIIAASGAIDQVIIDETSAIISGWALDFDDATSAAVAVVVDGQTAVTVPTGELRPDVAAVTGQDGLGFTARVELEPGTHQVCTHTDPDNDLVTCTRVATPDHLGVLVTPTGVMTRILEIRRGGRAHRVLTPCGKRAVIVGGTRIPTTQILLDPGHGGIEVASVGPNGLGEKQLNLDVALRTAALLRERGFAVELTRTTDMTLPIAIRAELANALEPDLFLSIHHNGGALDPSPVPGTQAYYKHGDRESRRAAGILYEELFAAAGEFPTAWVGNSKDGVSARLNAEGGDFYGIHRRTPNITSVITEFLWLSNDAEARLLARDDVRQAEAEALADGVERWYRSTDRGSGYLEPFVDTFDSGGGGFDGCIDPVLQ